jgi:hypothetical protein
MSSDSSLFLEICMGLFYDDVGKLQSFSLLRKNSLGYPIFNVTKAISI